MNYGRSLLTVTSAAADYSLIDLATAKDELGITDSLSDARLTRWIRESIAPIQNCVGRVLRSETVRETFRGGWYGHNSIDYNWPVYGHDGMQPSTACGLALRRYPIVSVTTITVDGTALDPATEFEIDAELGMIYRLSSSARIAWYGQLVLVDYIGGYPALTDVPGDIVQANLILMKHRRATQTREPGLRAMTIPGVLEREWWVPTAGEQTDLPPEAAALLAHYRDVRI